MSIQSRKLIVEFTKMSGAGNDFIVIDNRFYNFSRDELSEMAKNLCRRRISLGADGILALCNPDTEGASFRMMYYNADGSLGTMCGNGARCLARFAREAGL
ncbi:MAG: diaminopimelate epimerase, partial [Bacteroidetes Order II. Incertae sedis bacterium]|nr:diaminopimelate epimerase [Bacteroidetes Order II. bacterium]